jgi:hypothetical protein
VLNAKFKDFMNLVPHFFAIAFPLELRYRKKPSRHGWITQGIKTSSKEMRSLKVLYKQQTLQNMQKCILLGIK